MYKDKQATWRPHWRRNSSLCQHRVPSPGDSHRRVSPYPSTLFLLLPDFYCLE